MGVTVKGGCCGFMRMAFLASAVALASAGCYSVRSAVSPTLAGCRLAGDDSEIVAHLCIQNFGLYLFGTLPVFCGDPDGPSWFPISFFHDRVNDDELARCLVREAGKFGSDIEIADVTQSNSDTIAFNPPGFDIPIVVPYIICFRDNQISALVVRRKRGDGEGAQ